VALTMPRPTPFYDRAAELADELEQYLRETDPEGGMRDERVRLVAALSVAHAHLAIVEALHGTIFVANANAV
jgi:hypothetical protein